MVYNRSARLPEDATAKQRIEAAATYYAFIKEMPTVAGKRTLTEIAGLLNENPDMNWSSLATPTATKPRRQLNARYANMDNLRTRSAFLVEAARPKSSRGRQPRRHRPLKHARHGDWSRQKPPRDVPSAVTQASIQKKQRHPIGGAFFHAGWTRCPRCD